METLINNRIKLKLLLGFGLGFLLVVFVQYYSSKSIKALIADEQKLQLTNKAIQDVERLKADISTFESKMRGFVITGNEKFLEGNENVQLKSLETTQKLISNSSSPAEKHLGLELEELVHQKITFNKQILIEYNKDDNSAAIALIKTGMGKRIMDSIAVICDKVIQEQKKHARAHSERNDFNTSLALNADLISGIIILITIVIALIILFKDINDRIKLEAQLREEQRKVEKSMQIKEQFMANMSHEIRTPLNAMLGFSSLLEKTNLSTEQKDYLSAIDSAGKSLMTIINDILDFSKMEAGMLGIESVPFSVPQLMQSVHMLFFPKAESKGIKLFLSMDPGIPDLVKGDPTRLNQVLMNLIGNAIKFTSNGNVSVDCLLLKGDEKKATIRFLIKDTGIGIPQEKLQTIFDRFNQADNDTTRNFGGTGLGLSIAKKLIQLQGGDIEVNSTPGAGSEFWFTITYEIADKQEYEPSPVRKKSIALNPNKRVLIVEDNILNQKLAIMLLKEQGLEPVIV
ncbi:MAG TPA: ATP-binding protein, partial [Bacteroidia bacterium]